jgi:hypothetical protein
MYRPLYALGALFSLGTLSACNDQNGNFVHTTATAVVQFVNASDTPISVLHSGVLDTLNTNLVFGGQSACLLIDLNALTPITFTNGRTRVTITGLTFPLFVGGNFTIVAFADATGLVQFATLSNVFTPAAGNGGLRFFNAAPTSGTVTMFGNNVALTGGVNFGGNSGFVNVPPTAFNITFRNTSSLLLNAGTIVFPTNQNTTAFLGAPSPTTASPFRFFTTVGC